MALAREALRRVVLAIPGHQIAWMADDGAEAVERAVERSARPDPHGPVHAPDGRRRGDPPDHGRGALPDRRRHGDRQRPHQQGLRGDGPRRPRRRRYARARDLRAISPARRRCARRSHDRQADRQVARPGVEPLDDVAWPARLLAPGAGARRAPAPRPVQTGRFRSCLLGASTGGPNALAEILEGIPQELGRLCPDRPARRRSFAPGLASWLARAERPPVELAAGGRSARTGPASARRDERPPGPDAEPPSELRRRAARAELSAVGRRALRQRPRTTGPSRASPSC